ATTGPTTTSTEPTAPEDTVPTITLPPSLGRPKTTTEPQPGDETQPSAQQQVHKHNGLPVRVPIPDVTPRLTAGHYVFPVYGPSAYGDSFGAPRGDVSG